MKIRVLFLYGGDSVEHEISIISALQAMDGLDTERYEAIPCYVSKQGDMYGGEHLRKLAHYRDLDALLQRATRVHIAIHRAYPLIAGDGGDRTGRIRTDARQLQQRISGMRKLSVMALHTDLRAFLHVPHTAVIAQAFPHLM